MKNKNLELLNEFANQHTLADHIKVTISDRYKSFNPRDCQDKTRYEDAELLSSMITGAEHFVYFLERNGFRIVK